MAMATKKELEEHIMREEGRLDRIESKIDKLSDAMVSLARTEEKILSIEESNRNNYQRMNRFSEKLDNIDNKVNQNTHVVNIISKLAYITAAAVIGAIVKMFWF